MLHFAFVLLLAFQEPGILHVNSRGEQRCLPDQQICTVTDDVVVTYEDIRVEANALTINYDTGDVTSTDHVKFTRANERLEGEHLSLNVNTKAGTMKNVDGHVGPSYYFKAAEVERFEDGKYVLHDAIITTCDNPKPGWSMQFQKAYVIPGQSVTASASVFRLEGLPIFYFPYVVLPTVDR